ncbi:MAG: hypothetical protein ACRED1_09115 [Limisphaerales bacterium]
MNINGPICPKCQKALSYDFALKLFNPYDFRCPNCDQRLRSRMISIQILGYAVIGAMATVPVLWYYMVTWAWTTPMFLAYLALVIPLALLGSHFIFWKTDRVVCKGEAATAAATNNFISDWAAAGKSLTR